MIVVPEEFARCTVEREGEPGAAWLAGLPGIVEEVLGSWDHVPYGAVTHGGGGPGLDVITQFADRLAELLARRA